MKCPKCGANASGKFCSNCGTSLGAAACAKCGAPLGANAKFCHACGTPAVGGGTVGAGPRGVPWFLVGAGVIVILVVVGIVQLKPGSAPPVQMPAASQLSGTVDLSQISPRDAADRLFNRVMQANEGGVRDTAVLFGTMALQAYQMLDTLDDDARFHIGLIEMALGNPDGALAQADTIARGTPTSLFASMLRADAYRARGDTTDARAAEQSYLSNFDAEMAAQRPGYQHHGSWLSTYRNNIRR
jgi:Double zinc ribbon